MRSDLSFDSHHLYTLILGGKLTYAPVDFAHEVLDLGCGTGMWAM
jgi:predicted TPR repeat methyltransferase